MKKLLIISGILSIGIIIASCGGAEGNDPGRAYMPDMYYSRAYEALGYNQTAEDHDLKSRGVFYNAMPVNGTIARGETSPYPYPGNDSGYALSRNYVSPFDTLQTTPAQMKEGERLYLIHCGICHGAKLDGNGPLWKGGDGPYPLAPRNLLDEYSKALTSGTIHHVIVHGKGLMGSYASQVRPQQRAWIVKYIKSKQGPAAGAASADSTAAATAPADSTTR